MSFLDGLLLGFGLLAAAGIAIIVMMIIVTIVVALGDDE